MHSTAYISVDVEKDRAVFHGYVDVGPESADREAIEYAPTTESLREILDWAFERTEDVLVRLDWAGTYWRARRMTGSPSPVDLEGEILLAGRSSDTSR